MVSSSLVIEVRAYLHLTAGGTDEVEDRKTLGHGSCNTADG
jgi:hypothetical protein